MKLPFFRKKQSAIQRPRAAEIFLVVRPSELVSFARYCGQE